jgi:DNA-binding transcriptional ArsR family regulator
MSAPIPDEVLDLMADKFRMLADSTRLAILRELLRGERNVAQVVEATSRNQANVSKHLKMLAEAGLVARRKVGLQVFYRIDDPLIDKLCELVCKSVARDAADQVKKSRQILGKLGASK